MKNSVMKWWVMLALTSVSILTQAQNRFYTEDFEIAAGETKEIVFYLDNTTVYTAFQADIYFPKGISVTITDGYYDIFPSDRLPRRYTVDALYHEEGDFTRIMGYSTQNSAIKDTEGELVYLQIYADETFAGTHTLTLKNVRFATPPDEEDVIIEDLFDIETCTVTGPAIEEVPLYIKDSFYNIFTLFTRKGNSEKFLIEPTGLSRGIKGVSYNDEDVTSELVDGVFTTPAIESASTLVVEYDREDVKSSASRMGVSKAGAVTYEEIPLHIVDSEYGTITLYTERRDREKIGFTSLNNTYVINTVMFNDVDVTSELADGVYLTPEITEESTLSISYQIPTSEGMTLQESNLKVYGNNGNIVVNGCEVGESIAVYNTDGVLLHTRYATGNTVRIEMPTDAIYVVKAGNTAVKVAL